MNENGRIVKGEPLRSQFMKIVGIPAGIPAQRLVHGPVVVLHFHLTACVSTSGDLCRNILLPYYSGPNMANLLMTEDVPFDLKTEKSQRTYAGRIERLIKNLAKFK